MAAEETGTAAPKKKGMSPTTWIIILGVALAGGAYLLYKHSQSTAAAATSTQETAPEEDYSGQIATLQAEIEDLQSSGAQTTTTNPGGPSTPPTGTKTPAPPVKTTPPPKTGTPKPKAPSMPTGAKVKTTKSTSATVGWNKTSGATSYQWRVTYQDKLAKSGTVTGTTASVSGLGADHTYTFHVKACNSGGCSAETNGPTIHTPKG